MTYTFTADKFGSNTTFTIPNGSTLIKKMPSRAYSYMTDAGDLVVSCTNKREAAEVELAIERANKSSRNKPVQTQSQKNTHSRYITTLDFAEAQKLNHGKAWFCTEMDIELNGASPAFEGELICYVYEK
ncbi:hypothetical protein [Xenorhabdus bovienii]|uniref:hypothetical protein n=1 Tax=Xenorhabdus bovienii TaxID=40576 RepID=UPI003DA2E2DF